MLHKLSATKKGLLTGLAMIALSLVFVMLKKQPTGLPQYLIYIIYTAGIVWTLWVFQKNSEAPQPFKTYFSEGFKCFIVVTLLMVVYTFVFFKIDHTYQDAMANQLRQDLVKGGNATPAEIDKQISSMKSNFALLYTAGAVFFYLFIGALVTAVTSAFITSKK
jgi:Ca2+/Na+ antiporter